MRSAPYLHKHSSTTQPMASPSPSRDLTPNSESPTKLTRSRSRSSPEGSPENIRRSPVSPDDSIFTSAEDIRLEGFEPVETSPERTSPKKRSPIRNEQPRTPSTLANEQGMPTSSIWKNVFKDWDTSVSRYEDIPDDRELFKDEMDWFNDHGISFERQLGSGGFGTVWLVKTSRLFKDKSGNYRVACRVISTAAFRPKDPSYGKTFDSALTDLLTEGNIQHKLVHPNLVKCEEILYLPDSDKGLPMIRALLFMELCGGNLADLMAKKPGGRLDESCAFAWFRQICEGLAFLHNQNVCHFDIRIENVMFVCKATDYTFKLSDFGLAHRIATREPAHTRKNMPPEMYRLSSATLTTGMKYYPAKPADIYCLGRALTESLAGRGQEEHLIQDGGGVVNHEQKSKVNPDCAKLIRSMCQDLPENRPTIKKVKHDQWFSSAPKNASF